MRQNSSSTASSGACLGWRQASHRHRTRRCDTTPISASPSTLASRPRSSRRGMEPSASLVCKVDSTRCPVSAACKAMRAVSSSRISPTSTTSGSWRRMERSVSANDSPCFSFTCTCEIPGSTYSTGSSIVMMLTSTLLSSASSAYSVEVLPDPVGPVSSTMPALCPISRCSACWSAMEKRLWCNEKLRL